MPIAEPYELNNSLEDRTDALSLVLAVTPELYAALETPVDPKWPFSAEDWLQKQIAAMNEAFARSVYPSTPDGITERVRLGKIVVTSTEPPTDWEVDGGFYMGGDDRQGNPYYHPATDVSGALLHELAHQLGVIDLYNLGAEMLSHQLVDRNGQPVQIETGLSYQGLMLNPGIDPPIFEEHSAHGLNTNKGFRRGYYGEYLFDLPQTIRLRVLDNTGAPAPGVDVRLYQSGPGRELYPTITDDIPEITGTTDEAGLLVLPNRPVGDPVATRTRHTLADNPFGVVDIIGERDEFIVELARESHQEYAWLEITRLNLAAWRGEPAETTVDVTSHVPQAGAPAPPKSLEGEVAFGQVALHWPASPSPGIAGFNLYRTRFRPDFTYDRILMHVPVQEYVDAYDYSQRAVTYAVTAVDAQGRESGFSPFFNAFSLVNPAAIAVDRERRANRARPAERLPRALPGSRRTVAGHVGQRAPSPGILVVPGPRPGRPPDLLASRRLVQRPAVGEGGGPTQRSAARVRRVRHRTGAVPQPVRRGGLGRAVYHRRAPDARRTHAAAAALRRQLRRRAGRGRHRQRHDLHRRQVRPGAVSVDADDLLTYPTAGNLNRTQGADRVLGAAGMGWRRRPDPQLLRGRRGVVRTGSASPRTPPIT